MKVALAVAAYIASMTLANLIVADLGPSMLVVSANAFIFIGLDLALRDWLQVSLRPVHMGALIALTGLLTYMLNPAAHGIAVASGVSFAVAALVDWAVFTFLKGSWLRRSLGSNAAGAAVDSLIFPTLAFGALLPGIVLAQFATKVIGSALWAAALSKAKARGVSP